MKSLLVLLVLLFACGSAMAGELFIVGAINGGIPRKQKVFFLKKGETLKLSVVRKTAAGHVRNISRFEEKGRVRKVTPQRNRGSGWLRIEPVIGEYNNLKDGGQIEPIRYRTREIASGPDLTFPAAKRQEPFGTRYLAIKGVKSLADEFSATLPLHEIYPYQVVQVVYRADDSYLGYLTELFGTPFIIAPKVMEGGLHESESRIGCDCASFAVYGRRRQGYRATYNGPRGIYRSLDELLAGPLYHVPFGESEAYAGDDGKVVTTENIQPGDIIHFGEQVSVFYRDGGIPGILDKEDELMQCFGSTPVLTTFAKSGFYGKPLRVFRWKETGK